MKYLLKMIFCTFILGFISQKETYACDICGCGAGSYYIGILPEFNSQIFGLRYRSNSIQTHLGPGGRESYLTTDELYQTVELWGGWTFKEKFRVMAYLPLSYNSKVNAQGKSSKSGIGDAGIQGFYRIINDRKVVGKESKLLIHDVWIGGGVKFPLGKYESADKDELGNSANLFQLGTGSLDFILTGMYDVRLQDFGMNMTASYKINTTNQYDYYYGNRFSGTAQAYYKFRKDEKFMIAPNIGISYENSAHDLDEGYSVFASGGYLFFGTF